MSHEQDKGRQLEKQDEHKRDAGETEVGTRLSAHEIYENVKESGEEELARPAKALIWSALGAGLAIGFSLLGAAFLGSLAPEPWRRALVAAGYPLGFVFVVLARSQLFTENTLEPVIPLLAEPSRENLRKLGSLWGVVLLGNLAGALLMGWALARTPVIPEALRQHVGGVAREAVEGGFGLVLYRAVFAGWLIALMTWLVGTTKHTGAQIAFIWLTTAPISALGFRHSVAGAVEAFFLAFRGELGWGQALLSFEVPALLGNVIGGVLMVALLNHQQVVAGKAEG